MAKRRECGKERDRKRENRPSCGKAKPVQSKSNIIAWMFYLDILTAIWNAQASSIDPISIITQFRENDGFCEQYRVHTLYVNFHNLRLAFYFGIIPPIITCVCNPFCYMAIRVHLSFYNTERRRREKTTAAQRPLLWFHHWIELSIRKKAGERERESEWIINRRNLCVWNRFVYWTSPID